MIEGTLRAYYFQLRLSVEDYEFPHLNTGRDGNALACHVVIEDTEIGDSYPPPQPNPLQLRARELHRTTASTRARGLRTRRPRQPRRGVRRRVRPYHLAERQHGHARGVRRQQGRRPSRLGPIDIDPSFVADALTLFDDIIHTFPIRGDITAD